MEPIISTPRLKLTLITKAPRGSQELEWLHAIRSDKDATWWSILGQSKSVEETEKVTQGALPATEGAAKTYRVIYAVHKVLDTTSNPAKAEAHVAEHADKAIEFIGLVNVKSMESGMLALPEHLTLPAAHADTTLTVELGYVFLPSAWGKGYATESVAALFEGCRSARSFWAPFSKVYVRAIVNSGNPLSRRVMDKIGMKERGIYKWTGRVWLAGGWRTEDDLHIYGMYLLE